MCDCVDKIDGLLADQNAELVTTLGLGGYPRRAVIETQKVDPKKRARSPRMLASFCPFCGDKYEASAKAEAA